jgi:histidinol-phosphate aminotransferase
MKKINVQQLVRPNLRDLTPYSSARDEFTGARGVFLDANENPFPTAVNRYPDPHHRALKKKLAYLKGVMEEEILIGNGSDEVLDLLFRAFCEPGIDKIVTIKPSYGMYNVLANINNIEIEEVALTTTFDIDEEAILKAAEGAKMIVLCSPNNPTGNILNIDKIKIILEKFDGLVVVDEAYIDFSSSASLIGILSDFENLFVSQTLSKAFGLAGIRVGIGLGNVEVIELLHKIKPPYNVNSLSQEVALKRLENSSKVEEELIQIKMERSRIEEYLQQNELVKTVFPTDANFILFEVSDANIFYTYFVEHNVIVRNRTNVFGCNNCLRVTIGTKEENNRFIAVFESMKNEQRIKNL